MTWARPWPPSLIEKYEQILAADPRSLIFVELARALLDRGDPRRAMEVCRAGLEHHPGSILGGSPGGGPCSRPVTCPAPRASSTPPSASTRARPTPTTWWATRWWRPAISARRCRSWRAPPSFSPVTPRHGPGWRRPAAAPAAAPRPPSRWPRRPVITRLATVPCAPLPAGEAPTDELTDDVVAGQHPHELRRRPQPLRQVHVLRRRRRVAARVVVREDHRVGPLAHRRSQGVARAHRALRERALGHLHRAQQPAAHVEQHHVEPLALGVGGVAQELVDTPRVVAALAAGGGDRRAAPQLEGGGDGGGAGRPSRAASDGVGGAQAARRRQPLQQGQRRGPRRAAAAAGADTSASRSASERARGPPASSRSRGRSVGSRSDRPGSEQRACRGSLPRRPVPSSAVGRRSPQRPLDGTTRPGPPGSPVARPRTASRRAATSWPAVRPSPARRRW